jgi:hypothetical protein
LEPCQSQIRCPRQPAFIRIWWQKSKLYLEVYNHGGLKEETIREEDTVGDGGSWVEEELGRRR